MLLLLLLLLHWCCSKSHVKQGVLMYQDALKWIRTTYPYVSHMTQAPWVIAGGRLHSSCDTV
jgi:hypothetical protein